MLLPDGPTLESFLRALESLGDPEGLFVRDGRSTVAFDGEQGSSRILLVTRQHGLIGLRVVGHSVLSRAGIISCNSLVTTESAAFVAAQSRRSQAELYFVGDLDPHDLTIFVTLAVELRKLSVRVHYLGINDDWIELCRKFLPDSHGRNADSLPTIQLNKFETEHLRLLDDLPMRWDEVVGPTSMTLLRAGSKLELEGATNPACYREGFAVELERLIFGSA